ncbi:MAG: hypothetical protein ACRBCS_11635 [Cellvibrionaceae bacterium]
MNGSFTSQWRPAKSKPLRAIKKVVDIGAYGGIVAKENLGKHQNKTFSNACALNAGEKAPIRDGYKIILEEVV